MLTSSRSTVSSIRSSKPRRLIDTCTDVPFGPFNLETALSLAQPLALSPAILAIVSPRLMPRRNAGEPSKTLPTRMSPSMAWMVMPRP